MTAFIIYAWCTLCMAMYTYSACKFDGADDPLKQAGQMALIWPALPAIIWWDYHRGG